MGQADGKAMAMVLRGHFSMPGDMFDCHDWVRGCYWHSLGRPSDAAKRAAAPRAVPHNKE